MRASASHTKGRYDDDTSNEEKRTFDRLARLLVDDAPLARDGHHALDLDHVLCSAVFLLESLPDLEQNDALAIRSA